MRVSRPFLYFLFFIFLFVFFSYKLTDVPPGINIDEASIGYNASLIAENFQDENGRFLPIFILTLDGKDWKNPVNVYSTVLVFKILGKSYFNLRLVSVIYAIVSAFIFLKLLRLFFPEKLSFLGLLLFLSCPSLLLQGHLASDNISGLPPFLLWLYLLFSYQSKPNGWKIFFSGFFLGLSFYAYKGMRAMVPVYGGLSLVYLVYFYFYKIKELKPIFLFLLGAVPFFLPIRWLQIHYAGAIYDPAVVSRPSFFGMAYTYFSSFDFSFLFVTGDKMLVHSTGRHGIFLVPIFFLFFLGLFQMFKEKRLSYYFLLAVLLSTPLLLTLVGSVYRASRLMTYLPTVIFISTLGIKKILEIKQRCFKSCLLFLVVLALVFNYYNFVEYYWYDYPKLVRQDFAPDLDRATKVLAQLTRTEQKIAYLEDGFFAGHKAAFQFFWEVYFPNDNLRTWRYEPENLPKDGLILSSIKGDLDTIKNYKEIPDTKFGVHNFYVIGEVK